ncbi:hypothetical protein GC194_03015 [bacterium]|nr:hypothetical protein [bacterium]
MMQWMKIKKHQILSLLMVSLLCGIIWRLEIEYHGWTGLIWTTYFHIAIPIGFGLFLLWMNQMITLKPLKRLTLNIFSIILGVFTYFVLKHSLGYNYINGPAAMLSLFETDYLKINAVRSLVLIVPPLLPILAFKLLKVHGVNVRKRNLVLCEISLFVSLPFSMLILFVTGHKGGYDELHALKSGILIPFIVFTFGLLIVDVNKRRPDAHET